MRAVGGKLHSEESRRISLLEDGCSATGLSLLQSIAEWQGCVGEGRQLNDCGSHQQAAGNLILLFFSALKNLHSLIVIHIYS